MKNVERMYELFGYSEGKCKDCTYFLEYRYHNRAVRKCEIYGDTRSSASDWAGRNEACGLFPDKPYNGDREVIKINKKKQIEDSQIEGQMCLFDGGEHGENE